jgi:hypothetical protein
MKNEKTDELDANQSLFNFASGRRHHRFPKTTPFAEISNGVVSIREITAMQPDGVENDFEIDDPG